MWLYTILLVLYVLNQFKFKSLFLIKPHPCALFQSYGIRIDRGENRNMNFQHISSTIILHTKVEEQPGKKLLLDGFAFNPASNVKRESGQLQNKCLLQHHSLVLFTADYVELGSALQNQPTMVSPCHFSLFVDLSSYLCWCYILEQSHVFLE